MLPRVNLVRCEDADYLLFSTPDHISNVLIQNGVWDELLQNITLALLEGCAKPLLLDLGANLGGFSVPIGKRIAKDGGVIHAFEPQRVIYYQLCANIFINRLDNVYAHHAAIGETGGFVDLPVVDYNNFKNIGAFSLVERFRKKADLPFYSDVFEKTPIVSLSDLKFDGKVSLIKLDVEGYELAVLKGAQKFFEANAFPPILFESLRYEELKEERKELMSFLTAIGYDVQPIFANDFIAQHPSNGKYFKIQQIDQTINVTRIS